MKDILDYIYSKEGVIETLGTITPSDSRPSARTKIERLHNLVHFEFYQQRHTSFELRIDFEPKKYREIDLLNFSSIHKMVKNFFEVRVQRQADYVLMREWGKKGGRLHYHGIIYLHDEGNQTVMAKLKKKLVDQFGRRTKITNITYPDSYIPYMFKRFMNEKLVISEEIISSRPLMFYINTADGHLPVKEIYTMKTLEEYENKRTKK